MAIWCAHNLFGQYWFNTYPETRMESYAELFREWRTLPPSLFVGYILGDKTKSDMEFHGHKFINQFDSDEGIFADFNQEMTKKGHMTKKLASYYYKLACEADQFSNPIQDYDKALKQAKEYMIGETEHTRVFFFDQNQYLYNAVYPSRQDQKHKVIILNYNNTTSLTIYCVPSPKADVEEYNEWIDEVSENAVDHIENLPNHHIFWYDKDEFVERFI